MSKSTLSSAEREALARLIEGEAEPADETLIATALQRDPALLDVVREQLCVDSLLSQEATGAEAFVDSIRERINAGNDAGAFEQRVAAALPRRTSGGNAGTWLPIAAAVIVLLAIALWWPRSQKESFAAQLSQVSGVVSWSSEEGEWKSSLADGARLNEGTLSVEGETSSAVLVFRDDTRVTVTGNSELTFSDNGQKRLRCARGSLSADVAPQAQGRPMLVRTPTAEIEVVGTIFTVDVEPAATSVAVERGSVRVRRIDDPQTTDLVAEQIMMITAERQTLLAPRSARAAVSHWRASFDSPLDERWSGAWLPSDASHPKRVASMMLLVGAGEKFLKPGVKILLDDFENIAGGGLAIGARSVVRVRVRSPEDDHLDVFVNTCTPGGAFAGNFQRIVPLRSGVTDAQGWCRLEVDLGAMPPVAIFQERFPSPQGARVKCVLLTANANFEISELEILER